MRLHSLSFSVSASGKPSRLKAAKPGNGNANSPTKSTTGSSWNDFTSPSAYERSVGSSALSRRGVMHASTALRMGPCRGGSALFNVGTRLNPAFSTSCAAGHTGLSGDDALAADQVSRSSSTRSTSS